MSPPTQGAFLRQVMTPAHCKAALFSSLDYERLMLCTSDDDDDFFSGFMRQNSRCWSARCSLFPFYTSVWIVKTKNYDKGGRGRERRVTRTRRFEGVGWSTEEGGFYAKIDTAAWQKLAFSLCASAKTRQMENEICNVGCSTNQVRVRTYVRTSIYFSCSFLSALKY